MKPSIEIFFARLFILIAYAASFFTGYQTLDHYKAGSAFILIDVFALLLCYFCVIANQKFIAFVKNNNGMVRVSKYISVIGVTICDSLYAQIRNGIVTDIFHRPSEDLKLVNPFKIHGLSAGIAYSSSMVGTQEWISFSLSNGKSFAMLIRESIDCKSVNIKEHNLYLQEGKINVNPQSN